MPSRVSRCIRLLGVVRLFSRHFLYFKQNATSTFYLFTISSYITVVNVLQHFYTYYTNSHTERSSTFAHITHITLVKPITHSTHNTFGQRADRFPTVLLELSLPLTLALVSGFDLLPLPTSDFLLLIPQS